MNSNLPPKLCPDGFPVVGLPLGQALSAHAEVTPHAPALSIGDKTWTFAELDCAANRRARALALENGVTQWDRVVVSLPNCVEFFESVFAVWKLGATPCPLSCRMAPAELENALRLVEPRCVVGDPERIGPNFTHHNPWASNCMEFADTPLSPLSVSPGRIMTSGGSTGQPKLIIDPVPSTWGPDKKGRRRDPRTIMLQPAPLYHSAPFAYSTAAILEGSHVVCLEKFDPGEWLDAVAKWQPRFAYLVPTMMSRIAKLPSERTRQVDLSSLETVIHMAAPCPQPVKRWWINRIGPEKILEVYGGTERIGATVIDGTEWLAHPGSVGKPAQGYKAFILAPDGTELPPGEIGEIYFRADAGPAAAYAYIGSDTRVRGDLDSFGDMGWLDEDGYLYIADRRTDMVVIGGVNVFPAEIEAAIESLPGVACAAVIGVPDNDLGNVLHVIVELDAAVREPLNGLDFLKPALVSLSTLKHPRSVEFTRERVRDDTGKVRRFQLRADRVR
jgi:bile acid-coenzyme A ligase